MISCKCTRVVVAVAVAVVAAAVVIAVVVAAVIFSGAAQGDGDMRLVPSGEYRPLYGDSADIDQRSGKITLEDFYLDAGAVSNAAFLEFVRTHPQWRKSRIKKIFADENYLAHWHDDMTPGPATAPVVNVSWFAARAFCHTRGAALPTTAQWEFAAAASETEVDASGDAEFLARILTWYSLPNNFSQDHGNDRERFKNLYGIYDLHGSVWEWVLDFNTALTSGESRADSSRDRQLYCAAGVVGAATYVDYPSFLRHGYRSSLDGRYTHGELGFRCAATTI